MSFFLKETPKYHFRKGQVTKMMKNFTFIARFNGKKNVKIEDFYNLLTNDECISSKLLKSNLQITINPLPYDNQKGELNESVFSRKESVVSLSASFALLRSS